MVVYTPAFNIVGLNILTNVLFQIFVVRRLLRRPVGAIVIYNFSPSMVALAAWLSLRSGVRLLNNVEDVSVPQLKDWSRRTEARPIQQFVFWICMNLVARICDAYIVPTRRFLGYLPSRPAEVITGCIEIPSLLEAHQTPPPIRVLYAGKVEREHGIVQFVEALEALDNTPAAVGLQVDVSGAGYMTGWVAERFSRLKTLRATAHGFVSSNQYEELLCAAHICVALQDPEGRYAQFKTPSKIYEFLGYGKAVIVTDVGDVREITASALCVLNALESIEIARHLSRLSQDPDTLAALQGQARRHSIEHFSYEMVGSRLRRLMQEKLR